MSNASRLAICNRLQSCIFENHIYSYRLASFNQRRSKKYKQKWASNLKPKTYTEQALQHFDIFYGKYYGKLWPSLRISLLSQQKSCAVVNQYNAVAAKETEITLEDLGAENFIKQSNNLVDEINIYQKKTDIKDEIIENNNRFTTKDEPVINPLQNKTVMFSDSNVPIDDKNTSLYDFVPTEKVYTDKEFLKLEVIRQSTFEDRNIPTRFIIEDFPKIPESLQVFCFSQGNINKFPSPQMSKGIKPGYFITDAANILPVIALNIQSEDSILNICATQVEKVLAMLQYPHLGTIVCNKTSNSKANNLVRILETHCSQEMIDRVTVHHSDGKEFTEPRFHKVLVDVPCTVDRRSLFDEDNNIFRPGRIQERLALPEQQKNLLVSGLKSCLPGGYVVYSTSTLSPAENDGVVQAALEHVWKETNIDIAVVDLGYMTKLFRKTYRFFKGCKFGQLVLPNLSANFGPLYLCKLKRIK